MKNSIYTLTSILFCALLSVASFAQNRMPEVTTIINEERSAFNSTTYLDSDCIFRTEFTIHIANLDVAYSEYRRNQTPLESATYNLPDNYPPMVLAYTVGDLSFAHNITSLTYATTIHSADGDINIFSATFDVAIDVSGVCQDRPGSTFWLPWTSSISTYGRGGQLVPYPMCDYTASYDIFSCSAFQETMEYCNGSETCSNSELSQKEGAFEIDCNDCGREPGPVSSNDRSGDQPGQSIAETLIVSPNPFKNQFTVSIPAHPKKLNIRLFNATGKLIRLLEVSASETNELIDISTSHLSGGIYFLQVSGEQLNKTYKMIKY